MEKEFVSYETSLALKELGFNENCFAAYRDSEWIGHDGPNSRYFHAQLFSNSRFDDDQQGYCSAPLKQQVFRWFRDNHSLDGWAVPYYSSLGKFYCFIIEKGEESNLSDSDDDYNTHEEAESACIDKLIELVKQGK